MENQSFVWNINAKALGAVTFGYAGWSLWPKGDFDPYAYGWYGMGGLMMISASAMALGAAIAVGRDFASRREVNNFKKNGSGLHTAGWATEADLEEAGMFDPVEPPLGLALNGRALFGPHKMRIPHWKHLAPSGAGKTTCAVVPSVMHAALSPDGGAVATIDNKDGEISEQSVPALEAHGITCVVIDDRDVTSLRKTRVNPFGPFKHAFMQRDARASMMARELALTLEPEPADDPKGRFWRDGQREFLTFGLLALAQYTPEDCTPTGLWRLLSSEQMLRDALKASSKASGALGDLATRILMRKKSSPEHYDDFLSTARRRVEIYEEGGLLEGVGEGSDFDHASIKSGQMAVFIVGSQEGGDVLAPNTMLHLTAFLQATKTKPSTPVRFIVDEATNSPVQSLVEEFTKLRAYGGRIQFIAQAESEIRKKFGDKSAETIETQCGVKQIMGVSKHDDAERLSKILGMGPGVAESINPNGKNGENTKNLSDQGRPLMTASEILQMPRDEQIILVDGLPPIRAKKLAQNEIGPWGDELAPNPLEGGKLPFKPKITITYGKGAKPNTVRHRHRIGKINTSKRTWLFRPAHFFWVPVAACLALASVQLGDPHFRWSYSYQEFAGRTHYNRCEYVGLSGSFTLRPTNGQCPFITFRRS